MRRLTHPSASTPSIGRSIQTRLVVPPHPSPQFDSLVQKMEPRLVEDFGEAAAILQDSPRMAAVLARRIVDALLERYAGRKEHFLGDKLREFANDTSYKSTLRRGVGALNQLGIFGAHEKIDQTPPTSDQPEVIDVTLEQAEWTLDLAARLFDLFIVSQARDEAMIAAVEEMAKRTKKPD